MTTLPPSALWPIRDDRTLSAYAKLAYAMLWTRQPDIRPSMPTLAADMHVSVRCAQNAVRELKAAGLLTTVPRFTEAGDPDANQFRLRALEGGAPHAPGSGTSCTTGGARPAPKDSNSKTASEGRNTLASRRARPAVTRAEDQIELVKQAVAEAYWDTREVEDEEALDVWARFVTDRKTSTPLAAPVKYLAGIFESFESWDGVLSNTPERE